jgi:hypothetical protein
MVSTGSGLGSVTGTLAPPVIDIDSSTYIGPDRL